MSGIASSDANSSSYVVIYILFIGAGAAIALIIIFFTNLPYKGWLSVGSLLLGAIVAIGKSYYDSKKS